MKERVFAAVREMKREQWLICGLAGLLLLVIAAPVKQKEQKKTQEKTTVSQTQEQTDDQYHIKKRNPVHFHLLTSLRSFILPQIWAHFTTAAVLDALPVVEYGR